MGKEGDEFGDEVFDSSDRFYTSYNHFAVVKNGNMSRMPFSNQGRWEEFSFVKHCSTTRGNSPEGNHILQSRTHD